MGQLLATKTNKISLMIYGGIITICFFVVAWLFGWNFGLTSYTTTTKTETNTQTNIITTTETHPGKILWDLLDLFIVPLVLGIGIFFLNKAQSENEQLIALNQQEETLLQNYIDSMTTLVLEKNLHQANRANTKDKDLRNIARSRTLTVLRALDTPNQDGNNRRRASLLRFLYETELITEEEPVINLKKANLEVAYLRNYDLKNARFEGVDFYKADLRDADLRGANLEGAYLVNAKLQGANFAGANLNNATLKGASYGKYVNTSTIWPDGFSVVGKGLIKKDIKNSRDWSKK